MLSRRALLAALTRSGALLVCVLAAGFACVPRTANAPPPSRLELTEAARAATVLVQGDFTVGISVPQVEGNPPQLDDLIARIQQLARTGQIRTQAAAAAYYEDQVLCHPGDYLKAGADRATDTFRFEATGSGFFLTSDGYLVTAAHIAAPAKNDVRQLMLDTLDAGYIKSVPGMASLPTGWMRRWSSPATQHRARTSPSFGSAGATYQPSASAMRPSSARRVRCSSSAIPVKIATFTRWPRKDPASST